MPDSEIVLPVSSGVPLASVITSVPPWSGDVGLHRTTPEGAFCRWILTVLMFEFPPDGDLFLIVEGHGRQQR